MIDAYNGILFSLIKEENSSTCNNMHGRKSCYTKWSKPEKGQIIYDHTIFKNIKY